MSYFEVMPVRAPLLEQLLRQRRRSRSAKLVEALRQHPEQLVGNRIECTQAAAAAART
jgi:hypothetical protein